MRTRIGLLLLMGVIWAAEYAPGVPSIEIAARTPSSGITQVLVATGIFEPFNVKQDQENWQAKLKVNGILTNITYQSSVAVPGATTGWHSHPGPLLITVTAGAVTVYNAEDPTCTPRVFTAGQGFVEPETQHILRNEGTVEARWTSANIRPIDQPARFDAPAPGTCPF
jgi:quercetin dioxygenase-like cupin family protein